MAETLTSLIQDLKLLLASVEWSDLSSVGKLVAATGKALALATQANDTIYQPRLTELKEAFEAFIMREYKDKQKAITALEKQVGALPDPGAVNGSGQSSEPLVSTNIRALGLDQEKDLREYALGAMSMIEELEQNILELEKDSLNSNLINGIFRIVHTLKGETGFAGLPGIAELLHHFEGVFSILREKPIAIDGKTANDLLSIVDVVKKTFELCGNSPFLAIEQFFPAQGEMLTGLKATLKSVPATASAAAEPPSTREVERINTTEIGDISIYTDFIHEMREHLERIEVMVLELETNPGNTDILNEIFRPLHTIKGVSGFLSLKHINRISHATENFLDLARSGKLAIDLLRRLDNLLEQQIKGAGFSDDEYPAVEALLQNIQSTLDAKRKAGPFPVNVQDIPMQMEKKVGEILVEAQAVSKTDLAEALSLQAREDMGKKIGQILIEQEKVTPRRISDALRQQMDSASKGDIGAVKVSTEKLDHLIDIVGELVISQTLIAQHPHIVGSRDAVLSKNAGHLTKIVRDIQWVAMSLRMVPVKQTFQKMARLIRDLSMKSRKKVDLVITGAETELDKNVVEQINDPLVHMIRNAVDHGIETPEERIAAGKAATGCVRLNAFHQGGNIVLEVKDDGKGLDREAVRSKAIEKGLIDAKMKLDDQELFGLIFLPGFSTAKVVTDVSGRGVGMDVVKKNIEKLGGTVAIGSEPGKGSMFTVRLPLTMAILDGMILKVGNERYLLPVIAIKESIKPAQRDITTIQNKGEVVNVRGTLIPLIRLYQLFGETPAVFEPWNAIIIIIENAGKPYGIMVDTIVGQQQVVIKSLKGDFRNVKGISGCSILGDGRVGLILDVKGLVDINFETVKKGIHSGTNTYTHTKEE